MKLLDGLQPNKAEMKKQLNALGISTDYALLIMIRIDNGQDEKPQDNTNINTNTYVDIRRAFDAYLSDILDYALIEKGKSSSICVCWAKAPFDKESAYGTLTQVLEQIQHSCKLLGIGLSMLVDSAFFPWAELDSAYNRMKMFLSPDFHIGGMAIMYFDAYFRHPDDSAKCISRLHQYIQNNLNRDLSLTKLAGIVNFSPSYLSRFYKNETGTGLKDYINMKRIERATKLLMGTDMKIQEIATKVGFERSSYFTKVFKEQRGVTPQEFRAED